MDFRAVVMRLQDIAYVFCLIGLFWGAISRDVVELLFWGPMSLILFFTWRDNVQERQKLEDQKTKDSLPGA